MSIAVLGSQRSTPELPSVAARLAAVARSTASGEAIPSRAAPGAQDAAGRIADEIVRSLAPRSVFDAGCGAGLLVEALWDRGVEAHGRDASPFAVAQVRADMRAYCTSGPVAAPIDGGHDLVICLEALHHAPEAEALSAIAAMCAAAQRVLFSAALPDPDDPRRIAAHPHLHWLRAFAAAGFAPNPTYDASYARPHAILLERSAAGRSERDLATAAEMLRLRLALAQARSRMDTWQRTASDAEAGRAEAERRAGEALRQAEHQTALALGQAAHARQHRDALLRSTSWRVTWPLRAAIGLLRRDPDALRRVGARLGLTFRQPVAAEPPALPDAVRISAPPAPRTDAVDIVVCVHNALEDVRSCLAALLASTMPPYRLLLVDDGSSPETAAALAQFARVHGATLIRHERAKGYTYAANAGLRASTAPWVVLLNSDTIVTDGWLDRMVELGRRDARTGLVGPLSNTASWQSVPHTDEAGDWAENRLPDGIDIPAMARLVAGASARQGIAFPFLNGFCLMIRRAVLDDVGLFDEATFGAGYGEENDFCIRARKRGWRLLVADDAYVYHAQSRSYSREKRLQLARRADVALAQKYDHATDIMPQVLQCRDGLGPVGLRARVSAAIVRRRLIDAGRAAWEGRRIAFVLPISEAGGGANVVMQEARAMRRMGVDAWFVNLAVHRPGFEAGYPDFDFPCLWASDSTTVCALLEDHLPRFDAIVATAWKSVYWLPPAGVADRLGYYVQDFEPLFYDAGSADHDGAARSYLHRRDVRMFTKTRWNADMLAEAGAAMPDVIGASVDIDLFRPAPDPRADAQGVVRICAMLRPGTPRRAAGRTLDVLRLLRRQFGSRIAIRTFGCTDAECADAGLTTGRLADDGIENLGVLRTPQVAALMEDCDIFLDFSEWQALGLTAMEAMASGCAVVAPGRGGASVFARDGQTALLCDSADIESCREAAARLIEDDALRARLRRAGMVEVARHPPEQAAFAMLNVLLGDG